MSSMPPASLSFPAATAPAPKVVVRNVWADNLLQEFKLIRGCIVYGGFRLVSVDTEYPGTIYRNPANKHHSVLSTDEHYALLKANVEDLHLIQLGITVMDEAGRLPDLGTAGGELHLWQFNFREFDAGAGLQDPESVRLLRNSGLDLDRHCRDGVDVRVFGSLFQASGLFLNPQVSWVTFQGAYDLGYLIKVLSGGGGLLPQTVDGFLMLVEAYFAGGVYDVKHMTKSCAGLYGGLERVAEKLQVERLAGSCRHQAGSDSLLTATVFTKMCSRFFSQNGAWSMANVLPQLEVAWFRSYDGNFRVQKLPQHLQPGDAAAANADAIAATATTTAFSSHGCRHVGRTVVPITFGSFPEVFYMLWK